MSFHRAGERARAKKGRDSLRSTQASTTLDELLADAGLPCVGRLVEARSPVLVSCLLVRMNSSISLASVCVKEEGAHVEESATPEEELDGVEDSCEGCDVEGGRASLVGGGNGGTIVKKELNALSASNADHRARLV